MSLELSKQTSHGSQPQTLPGAIVGATADVGVQIPAAKGRATPTLSAVGLSVAEYKRVVWYCEAVEGVTLDDVLKTEYWAHVAARLQPFNRIEVVAYDGSWMADLIVLASGRTAAKVKVLSHHELAGGFADLSSVNTTHKVLHRGPRKWSVIRLSDNAIIKEDIANREDAERALGDYLKALGL